MAKNTGSYDDPIPVEGLFSKTIDGEKKFFKLSSNGPSVDTSLFIKKSGDIITGENFSRDKDDSFLLLNGGTNQTGASLVLYGKDVSTMENSQGSVELRTKSNIRLKCQDDGTLTWNNQNLVRAINNVKADRNGNVLLSSLNATQPVGSYIYFGGDSAPDGYLVCNGAEISRETYANLFTVIGTKYGKGDGVNATSKFGTAVSDGEDGNSIRVTVATNENDASSFDVTTYFKGSLVETQTVKKASELVNNSYVVWDTSVALVAGDDVTFTGGTGSTFNLPDMRDKFAEGSGTYTVGTAVEAGLPNITGIFTSHNHYPYLTGPFSSAGIHNVGLAYAETVPVLKIKMDANRCSAIYGNSNTVQPPAVTCLICIKY